MAENHPHRIVIVGGGAAGLEQPATHLGDALGKRGLADVSLIERSRTHLWKPLLHMVAAGSMDPSEHQLNYLAQGHWHHFRYHFGEMVGLDRASKTVHLGPTFDEEGRQIALPRSVPYDTLVIAIGSVTNDFGTPGAAEHAIPLETAEQAVRFQHRVLNGFLRAQSQAGPIKAGQLHVAIIGAGATGTELAAELYQTSREVIAFGLDHVDPDKDIRIILIEAANETARAPRTRLGRDPFAFEEARRGRANRRARRGGSRRRGGIGKRRVHSGRARGLGGRRAGAGCPARPRWT